MTFFCIGGPTSARASQPDYQKLHTVHPWSGQHAGISPLKVQWGPRPESIAFLITMTLVPCKYKTLLPGTRLLYQDNWHGIMEICLTPHGFRVITQNDCKRPIIWVRYLGYRSVSRLPMRNGDRIDCTGCDGHVRCNQVSVLCRREYLGNIWEALICQDLRLDNT